MGVEQGNISYQKESISHKAANKGKNVGWWMVEKSTFVTVPITVGATVLGVVSPAVGLTAIIIDLGGYKFAKDKQRSSKAA